MILEEIARSVRNGKAKDTKAVIFYFLMSLVLLDFGRQIRQISFNSYLTNYKNPIFSIEHVYNTGSAFGMFQGSVAFLSVFAAGGVF